MFSISLVALAAALAPLAVAQDASVDLKAIKAHFTQSALVPDLFTSFEPTALMNVDYPGVGEITPGQSLTKEQVGPFPTVTIHPAGSAANFSGTYTLAMVDADVVGAKLPEGQTRHWLVNGVTIDGTSIVNATAVGVTGYAGPWPAPGSGPHRYVIALYEQPASFAAPQGLSAPNVPVAVMDWPAYVKDSGLGPLVAANYINVQEGTATASISPTSAVVTSTLAPASSGSPSGSSSAAAPSGSGGASALSTSAFAVAAAAGLLVSVAL